MASLTAFTPGNNRRKNRLDSSPIMRRTMDIHEASNYTGFSVPKLRQLVRDRAIKFIQEAKGCKLLFEQTELDRWLDAHEVAA
jgi:excisionase family DNA binding protein